MDTTPPTASDKTHPKADQTAYARQVLASEAGAIQNIVIGDSFHAAVELILGASGGERHGAVVVGGVGKSGLIGAKISATFASTGTPSHFLHPAEAMHGDLGRIRRGDVVLLLSYGGSTDEVVTLATILRQDAVPVIAIVGQASSELGRLASVALPVGDVTEACALNLAPSASTTAMLALGDALALCVSRRRNFGVDDFRKIHPGGALGRQLMSITEAMRFRVGKNMPVVQAGVSVQEAFAQAEAFAPGGRRAGALLVVDDKGGLAGIFTDGDLRRSFIRHGSSAWTMPVGSFMTRNPRRLTDSSLVRDAVQMVREFRIDELPVVDVDGKPLGLIDVQDLVSLKVIEG
ncbi:MAG: KpsF/GutQ family sugar-phosphate isomerase [Planctomycetota bacterium]|nr:KpsF/GutQ family sugar-phosphate isomerase [Planctomycetota bacterium]